jgi:hypothetical protein
MFLKSVKIVGFKKNCVSLTYSFYVIVSYDRYPKYFSRMPVFGKIRFRNSWISVISGCYCLISMRIGIGRFSDNCPVKIYPSVLELIEADRQIGNTTSVETYNIIYASCLIEPHPSN